MGLRPWTFLTGRCSRSTRFCWTFEWPTRMGWRFIQALRQRPLHRATPIVVARVGTGGLGAPPVGPAAGHGCVRETPWKPQELAEIGAGLRGVSVGGCLG